MGQNLNVILIFIECPTTIDIPVHYVPKNQTPK